MPQEIFDALMDYGRAYGPYVGGVSAVAVGLSGLGIGPDLIGMLPTDGLLGWAVNGTMLLGGGTVLYDQLT